MSKNLMMTLLIVSALGGCAATSGGSTPDASGSKKAVPVKSLIKDESGRISDNVTRYKSPYDTGKTNLIITDQVDRDNGPGKPISEFDCGSKVYAFLTIYDDSGERPKLVEGSWIISGQKARVRSFEPDYFNTPHHVWYWVDTAKLGAGDGQVVFTAEGKPYLSGNFKVRANGTCAQVEQPVQAAPPARNITLGADGMFAFNKSGWSDLQPVGQRKLDQLANQLKSDYRSISRIVVTGHTDRLGTAAHNSALSEARAKTVGEYLVRNGGVDASVIQTRGVGSEKPVVSCEGTAKTASLVDCLLPNRRVEVEVTGVAK